MGLIYFADDDFDARSLVRGCLTLDGHDVKCFESGNDLLGEFLSRPCDLVILDVMMPGSDGFGVLKKIRSISRVPIIMLTAKTAECDCYTGFAEGADDYIGKPFRPILLRGKVHALLSRRGWSGEKGAPRVCEDLTCGNLCATGGGEAFFVAGKNLSLTPIERKYLYFMMGRFGNPVAREDALTEVWGISGPVSRVVDETNRRVRIKLAAAKSSVVLESVWGLGYVLKEVDERA